MLADEWRVWAERGGKEGEMARGQQMEGGVDRGRNVEVDT